MTTASVPSERPEAPLFSDGLGDRVVAVDGPSRDLLQILRVNPSLTAVPSFEFALRERTARLANFRHAYYARVRRIDRIQMPSPGLAIVSDHVEGTRLSDILRVTEERQLRLDINTALCLVRQLVPAVALLHENARDVAHGLIGPERILVTPHARLVIVEHVLGAAVEQLQFSRERLWQELRVTVPASAGAARFDHRADVAGIGLVALSLILGRLLRADEFPHQLSALLAQATERPAIGDAQPLSAPLRDWLARALQLEPRRAFANAPEALAALEETIGEASEYVAAPVALETFLSDYIAALLEPPPYDERPAGPSPAAGTAAGVVVGPSPAAPLVPAAPASVPFLRVQTDAEPTRESVYTRVPLRRKGGTGDETAGPSAAPAADLTPARPAAVNAAPVEDPAPPAAEPVTVDGAADEEVAGLAALAPDLTDLIAADDLRPAAPAPAPGFDHAGATAPAFHVPADEHDADDQAGADVSSGRAPARPALKRPAVLAAAAAVIALLGAVAWFSFGRPAAAGAASADLGTLDVQSNPSGVQVFLDGVERGQTPALFSVEPGAHILELRGRGAPRVIPINVTAGAQVSQYLELADQPETGQLRIQSEPAGASVSVDGVDRGVTPATVAGLAPGDHDVVVKSAAGTVRQSVTVQAGGTASLLVPIALEAAAAAAPVPGWLSVKAPVRVEIREGGRLLGTSDSERVMLASGKHDLEIVNELLGYRDTQSVQIPAGRTASLAVTFPDGTVNLNASPWAEVFIDGERVGETPIGNLKVALGPHEVVFRHPQLGEKRHAITVTLVGPVRLSVDMK